MKKVCCEGFHSGECTISTDSNKASLASRRVERLPGSDVHRTLTDPNDIYNFCEQHDLSVPKTESGDVVPRIEIVAPGHTDIVHFDCIASNCRSRQRDCNLYR